MNGRGAARWVALVVAALTFGAAHLGTLKRLIGATSLAEWDKLYFYPLLGQRRTNTHLRVRGRANQPYTLLFRDHLRSHPATAEAYAELKRRLAQNLADPQAYPEVKDPAVDLICLAAEDWAAIAHWQSGPPDA